MPLKDKTIIFLGNTRFDGNIKSTSFFIARNLAKENTVFFVDHPFTLKDYIKTKFNTKELKLRRRHFSLFADGTIDTDLANLKIVITPPVLPINFLPEGIVFRTLLNFNQKIIAHRLKKIVKKHNISSVIYVNAFNFHYPDIAKEIKPILSVYQCVDPMIVPYDMKHGLISEYKLVKTSDLVICTSKALFEEKIVQNQNTYFVPNGTDLNIHDHLTDRSYPLHRLLSGISRPLIGYLGTIERRIDYRLVEEIVALNPEKSFVFAGPVSENFVPNSLRRKENVHFIGPVAQLEVEQVINNFDVTIIPFKKDDVSNTIFPIKLFEYLSAGKAVVATDFNEDLRDYTDECVYFCKDFMSFSEALNDALQSDNEENKHLRRNLAKKNTWEIRSEQIGNILNSHLIAKS